MLPVTISEGIFELNCSTCRRRVPPAVEECEMEGGREVCTATSSRERFTGFARYCSANDIGGKGHALEISALLYSQELQEPNFVSVLPQ